MPPSEHSADNRLIAAYQEAALRILRALQGATKENRRLTLARINSFLSELDVLTAEYIKLEIPMHFKRGSAEAIEKLRAARVNDIDETFAVIHREALQSIVDDATLRFGASLKAVRDSSRGVLQEVVKRKIVAEISVGIITGTSDDAKKAKEILSKEGITSLRTRSGQSLTIENYSAMLTRTIISEAHNTGAATRYLTNGVQYGRVVERITAPDRPCQWFRGRYVNLADRRLYAPFHPNCMGGIIPVRELPKGIVPIESAEDPLIPADIRVAIAKRV